MASNANNEEYDFVKTPSEKYFCPVTFELLTDPRQTSECCGNRLSRAVAEKLEAEDKPCPMCKKAPLKTTKDLGFKREVMELKVYCSNKSAGCEWKGELGELERHLKLESVEGQCRFVDVQCPLECGKRIQRRHLKDHKATKCEKRLLTCNYCDYEATYEKVVNDHWPKCQRYPEVCPNRCSDEVIERRFLQNHLDEKCKIQETKCDFSHAGCQAKMKRQEIQDHLEAKKDEHLKMVSAKCKNLESELSDLKLAFTKIATKPVFIPPPDIIMNNFDKLKKDDTSWCGPPFHTHVGGYKLGLEFNANGVGSGKDSHVSVYIYMMKGEFDDHLKWPFRGEITVQLVNQKEGGENIERKPLELTDYDACVDNFQRVTEDDIASKGWGFSKFIAHTDLYNPDEGKEYLKNDTLIFKVTEVTVSSL